MSCENFVTKAVARDYQANAAPLMRCCDRPLAHSANQSYEPFWSRAGTPGQSAGQMAAQLKNFFIERENQPPAC
jgi:uncharacterized membrane protein